MQVLEYFGTRFWSTMFKYTCFWGTRFGITKIGSTRILKYQNIEVPDYQVDNIFS